MSSGRQRGCEAGYINVAVPGVHARAGFLMKIQVDKGCLCVGN